MKIEYQFSTGEVTKIEVLDDFGEMIIEIEKDEYNSNQRETRRHKSIEKLDIQLVDAKADIVSIIEQQEMSETLKNALEKLLPQQRELVQKVFIEGKSIAQIAREGYVSEGAIRDRLRKIYQRLKKLLTD